MTLIKEKIINEGSIIPKDLAVVMLGKQRRKSVKKKILQLKIAHPVMKLKVKLKGIKKIVRLFPVYF